MKLTRSDLPKLGLPLFAAIAMCIVAGLLVISGADKTLEAFLVNSSPEWLTNLTTRF